MNEIFNDPCKKFDAHCIDAFFELKLDPFSLTDLTLDNSWAETTVDLTPAIKAGETITHLLLTDSALQFNREDYGREGAADDGVDCVTGDELSRILSLQLLKDVKQPAGLSDGDVFMWNANSQLFETFDLQGFVDSTNSALTNLTERVATLEADLQKLTTSFNQLAGSVNQRLDANDQALSDIGIAIARPSWAPADASLVWGNINNMYAVTPTTVGLYSHNPATNKTGDERFK